MLHYFVHMSDKRQVVVGYGLLGYLEAPSVGFIRVVDIVTIPLLPSSSSPVAG